MNRKPRWLPLRQIARAALLVALVIPTVSRAAVPDTQSVSTQFNWYYATSFGTGVYTFNNTTVTAIALPFYYTMREVDDTNWGWKLTLPVTAAVGNFNLSDPDFGQINKIQLSAMSIMPGAEMEIPLYPHWHLSLFANAGRALEFDTKVSAVIYQAGVSTHYKVPRLSDPDVEVGAKYIYAGYTAAGADNTPVSLVSIGIASSIPLFWTVSEGRQTRLGLQIVATDYISDIVFDLPHVGYTVIHGELATGLTLGVRPALNILGAKLDRIGLSYVVGTDNLRGIRLVTVFPF
jgi:hypothetical protein